MPTISDAAVKKATGKGWNEWFPLLDAAGASTMGHGEITALVGGHFATSSWWRQMVTVEYERSRGLRVRHQTASGFTATASKTYAAPVERVYSAWSTARARRRWLADPDIEVRSVRALKSLRMTWKDGTPVVVAFTDKGTGKTQLAISHDRLKSAAAVARMKTYWKQQLASLQLVIER